MPINIGNREIQSFNIGSTPIQQVYVGGQLVWQPPVADTPPEARDVIIDGAPSVGSIFNLTYTYFDAEGDPEVGTTFQWYRSNDGGVTPEPIPGAITQQYTAVAADEGYQISGGVIPANVNATGDEALSPWSLEIQPIVTNPEFIMEFDIPSAGYELFLPLWHVVDINCDWGDGTPTEHITADYPTHVYASTGVHTIKFNGETGGVRFISEDTSAAELISVPNMGGVVGIEYFSFMGCGNLTLVDYTNLDESTLQNMHECHRSNGSLTDIIGIGTKTLEAVTTLKGFIDNCSSLVNMETTNWTLAACTDVGNFAYGCENLISRMNPAAFWENPNITDYSDAFTDAVNIENYTDIPDDWKGL